MKYKRTEKPFICYVDADWAGSIDNRRSYTGDVFILTGAAVTWEARKQATVALSSREVEHMALSEASKETIYVRNVLEELKFVYATKSATTIFCDH